MRAAVPTCLGRCVAVTWRRPTLLVIEVADSSLRYDRLAKMPLYAKSGIPEAWLVDVAGRSVTAYTVAGRDGYGRERTCRSGETVAATAVADFRLPIEEIFGG